jgi:response regulator
VKILIIEDDKNKRNQIIERLSGYFPDLEFIVKSSFQQGVKTLRSSSFDILLLDMTLPTFDIDINSSGGKIRNFAGMDILDVMQQRKIVLKTIVITQYESFGEELVTISQMKDILRERYNKNFVDIIYYSSSSKSWFESLKKLLGDQYESINR